MVYTTTGRLGYEIYFSKKSDGKWTKPTNITSSLGGSNKYLMTSSITSDGMTLYLVLQDPFNSDIYVSYLNRGRWSRAAKLPKPVNSKSDETHASISADGTSMFFASNRRGGEGDLDIYKTALTSKGKWDKPQNIGSGVNTPFNEDTPFVSPDGKTLYFSSEGHESMGGFDIFSYDLTNPSAVATNLGYPLNTTANDFFFVPAVDENSGYFAMQNTENNSDRQLYFVTLSSPVDEPVDIPDEMPELFMAESNDDINNDSLNINESEIPAIPGVKYLQEDYASTELMIYGESIESPEEMIVSLFEEDSSADHSKAPDVNTLPENEIQNNSLNEQLELVQVSDSEKLPGDDTDQDNIPAEEMPVSAKNISVPLMESTVNNVHAAWYTIQIMALKKPVDISYFSNMDQVMVTYGADKWYRYTWGYASDSIQAENLRIEAINKGYKDAFIRAKQIPVNYTIQIMAVPGPVVNLEIFNNLSHVFVTKNNEQLCRYLTGEYEQLEDARENLESIRQLGYTDAFVRIW